MRGKKIASIIALVVVFILILSFHSISNIKGLITPPSSLWGRSTNLAITPYSKQPVITKTDSAINVLLADENNFINVSIDDNSHKVTKNTISIDGSQLKKIVKYQQVDDFLFWTENSSLFMTNLSLPNEIKEKIKIQDQVTDFKALKTEKGIQIFTSFDKGLRSYLIVQGQAVQQGSDYAFNNAKYISAIEDNSGVLHVVANAQQKSLSYLVNYFTFADNNWQLKGTSTQTLLTAEESIDKVEIGLDNSQVYLFYELGKWDRFGISSKIYYSHFQLSDTYTKELIFDKLVLDPKENWTDGYFGNIDCADQQTDTMNAAMVRDTQNIKGEGGFKTIEISFKDGQIVDQIDVTGYEKWLKNIAFSKIQDGRYAAVILKVASEFKYEVWYTETGETYTNYANKPHMQDYLFGISNNLGSYINGSFLILLRLLICIPPIIWLIFVEFVEWKKMLAKPKLNFSIALIIYLGIKLFQIKSFYQDAFVILMPSALTFTGAGYFYAVLTTIVSLLLTYLITKWNEEMPVLMSFTIFMFIDIVIYCLLYSPYVL